MDFNLSKSKSLEAGGRLVVVRSCGSHVCCLRSTCGDVPSVALCSLSVFCRCHGCLSSDNCSAAECTCYGCVQMWILVCPFKSYKPNKHLKRRRMHLLYVFICAQNVLQKIQCEINNVYLNSDQSDKIKPWLWAMWKSPAKLKFIIHRIGCRKQWGGGEKNRRRARWWRHPFEFCMSSRCE